MAIKLRPQQKIQNIKDKYTLYLIPKKDNQPKPLQYSGKKKNIRNMLRGKPMYSI